MPRTPIAEWGFGVPRRSAFFLPHAAHFSSGALRRGGARCCNRRFANTATTITSERKNDSSIGGGGGGEKGGLINRRGLPLAGEGREEIWGTNIRNRSLYTCAEYVRGGGSGDDD